MAAIFNYEIITTVASVTTAVGAIVASTGRGRKWLIKPATDAIKEIKKEQNEKFDSIKRSSLRTELLLLLNNENSSEQDVYAAYEAYEALGGNFYMHELFERWKKEKELRNDKSK